MEVQTVLWLVAIGLAAGFAGGLIGIGGGVIVIPALVFIMGMSQTTAQGTNLAVMIPPIGLLAAMNYYKSGMINIKYAIIIAIFSFIGGYFGSKLAVNIDQTILKRVFGVFMLFIAYKMLTGK
jgi:uncharacterized membrane protein YfcA